jgi:hypothetical protein
MHHNDMLQKPPKYCMRRAVVAALLVACAACARNRDPIVIKDGMLVLENQSTREWRNVRVTINDHFSGGVRSLMPGGLMNAPLRDFQTGFGQKFDRGRMSVRKVVVSATDSDGKPVALTWGK